MHRPHFFLCSYIMYLNFLIYNQTLHLPIYFVVFMGSNNIEKNDKTKDEVGAYYINMFHP